MAYTLTNLQDDIRSYTEVDSGVLSNAVINTMIKNAENRIYRDADSDDNRFYATSNLQAGNRYVWQSIMILQAQPLVFLNIMETGMLIFG